MVDTSLKELNNSYGSGPFDKRPKSPIRNYIYIANDQFNEDHTNKMYRYMGTTGWEEILPSKEVAPSTETVTVESSEGVTPDTDTPAQDTQEAPTDGASS